MYLVAFVVRCDDIEWGQYQAILMCGQSLQGFKAPVVLIGERKGPSGLMSTNSVAYAIYIAT